MVTFLVMWLQVSLLLLIHTQLTLNPLDLESVIWTTAGRFLCHEVVV